MAEITNEEFEKQKVEMLDLVGIEMAEQMRRQEILASSNGSWNKTEAITSKTQDLILSLKLLGESEDFILGFIFLLSYDLAFDVTDNPAYYKNILQQLCPHDETIPFPDRNLDLDERIINNLVEEFLFKLGWGDDQSATQDWTYIKPQNHNKLKPSQPHEDSMAYIHKLFVSFCEHVGRLMNDASHGVEKTFLCANLYAGVMAIDDPHFTNAFRMVIGKIPPPPFNAIISMAKIGQGEICNYLNTQITLDGLIRGSCKDTINLVWPFQSLVLFSDGEHDRFAELYSPEDFFKHCCKIAEIYVEENFQKIIALTNTSLYDMTVPAWNAEEFSFDAATTYIRRFYGYDVKEVKGVPYNCVYNAVLILFVITSIAKSKNPPVQSRDTIEHARKGYNRFAEHYVDEELKNWDLAQKGDPSAQFEVGCVFEIGRSVDVDRAEARRWFTLSANNGFAEAQYHLGLIYLQGVGVATSFETAIKWFNLAHKQNFSDATVELAQIHKNGNGLPQNDSEAAKLHLQAAEAGNVYAQCNLANAFLHGQGVTQNFREAEKWYIAAAEQGDIPAQFNLFGLYMDTKNSFRDEKKALHWLEIAAEAGAPEAQFNLGKCYEDGLGVNEDAAKAVWWFGLAANQGFVHAEFQMGIMHARGAGVERSDEEALKWYNKAADHGDATAQFIIGNYLNNKEDNDNNKEEALKYFRSSAEQGHPKAQCQLAIMCVNGDGLLKDEQQALFWFKKSADQGNADAQYGLGVIYENGQGVIQNIEEAINWYSLAAEQEFSVAQHNLGVIFEGDQGITQDYETSFKWHQKAADNGYFKSQFNLGFKYSKGYGVKQDFFKAAEWYRKAADQGDPNAQNNLGLLYDNGLGVERDAQKAIEWYTKASEQGLGGAQGNLSNILNSSQDSNQSEPNLDMKKTNTFVDYDSKASFPKGYELWKPNKHSSIFSDKTSDFEVLISELDIWFQNDEKWEELNEHQLAELIYMSLFAYGVIRDGGMIPRVSIVYQHGISKLPAEERRNILALILSAIRNGSTSAVALLPFIICEPETGIVSSATIYLMATSELMDDDGQPYGLRELIPLIEKRVPENTGAVFGGLICYGDHRNMGVLNRLKLYLVEDEIKVAARVASGLLFHTTIEFWLSWSEELLEDGSDQAMEKFGSAASALVLQIKTPLDDKVIEVERYCPAFRFKEPTKAIQSWTIEEYKKQIAPRLYALEEKEDVPKLFSSVLSFWGMEPKAPVAERFNFT